MATILSWWTDPQFLKPEVRAGLAAAINASGITPSPTVFVPTPNWLRKIGIVSGHSGPRPDGSSFDPGAICEDPLGNVLFTENAINFSVASLVVRGLRERGYSVDLLEEFDPRLQNYQAEALVSIHANTCQDFGELVSGYLIAKADSRPEGGIDTLLAECVARYYGDRTKLDRRFGLTIDMTDYHSFREIHPTTPAAIIELGFMLADQEILTESPDVLAQGRRPPHHNLKLCGNSV
jgi:N-acetylmuramoyl-L-alanine amidase